MLPSYRTKSLGGASANEWPDYSESVTDARFAVLLQLLVILLLLTSSAWNDVAEKSPLITTDNVCCTERDVSDDVASIRRKRKPHHASHSGL